MVNGYQLGNSASFLLLLVFIFLLLLASLVGGIALGSVSFSLQEIIHALFFQQVVDSNPILQQILWDIRLPRTLMALITGAGLAVVGAVLQLVTRNPLADPYLFGISSGASLGAVIAMSALSAATISITFGAFIGGAFSVFLMLMLAGRNAAKVEHLVLSGVAVSFMLSAMTSLILYYSSPEMAATLFFWLMGSFSNSQWSTLLAPALVLFCGIISFFICCRWLSGIQAGDESAETLGIPVNQLRLLMLIICAAITSVLVAHVGGIGFVGLMIPHIARFMVGGQIHRLLIVCVLIGSIFMIWVDVLSRTLLQNQILPIGIVTSALGSFFFFVILKRKSNRD